MERIKESDLMMQIHRINVLTESPLNAGGLVNGKYNTNPGCYCLGWKNGYNLVRLERIADADCGHAPEPEGYATKRELYDRLNIFIRGLEIGKKLQTVPLENLVNGIRKARTVVEETPPFGDKDVYYNSFDFGGWMDEAITAIEKERSQS